MLAVKGLPLLPVVGATLAVPRHPRLGWRGVAWAAITPLKLPSRVWFSVAMLPLWLRGARGGTPALALLFLLRPVLGRAGAPGATTCAAQMAPQSAAGRAAVP